jgi:large subunit ribosomal protein L29
MKASQIRELTDDELAEKLREIDRELFNLRMQQATAQIERPSRLRDLRRDRARMLTLQGERMRGAK